MRLQISAVTLFTTNLSGVTSPLTMHDPRPQLPSIVMTERSPDVGLLVNMTPEQSEFTIRWITTPMATCSSGSCNRNRYDTDSVLYKLAQHERT